MKWRCIKTYNLNYWLMIGDKAIYVQVFRAFRLNELCYDLCWLFEG